MTNESAVSYLLELASQGDPSIADQINRGTFIYGYCGLYAAALVAHNPDWDVVAVGWGACQLGNEDCGQYPHGFCDCDLNHFYVKSPDGWYHDAYGQHDPSAIQEESHLLITDEAFCCVLESWYGFDRDSMDIAAVALLWAAEPEVNVQPNREEITT